MSSPTQGPTTFALNTEPNGPFLPNFAYRFLAVGFCLIFAYIALTIYLRKTIEKERVEKEIGERLRIEKMSMSSSATRETTTNPLQVSR